VREERAPKCFQINAENGLERLVCFNSRSCCVINVPVVVDVEADVVAD
jgi:hypothetical protein